MIVWVIALLNITTKMNKSQQVTTIFNSTVNSFMVNDPKHVNSNVFEAFTNNPLSFVDKNGRAPESALQILTNRFGRDDQVYYHRFNQYLTRGNGAIALGTINNDAIEEYDLFNYLTTTLVRTELSQQLPSFPPGLNMPELATEVYTSGVRGFDLHTNSRPRIPRSYFRHADFEPLSTNSQYLFQQSIEAVIESSGVGERVFRDELSIWRQANQLHNSMYDPPLAMAAEHRHMFESPEDRILTAEELGFLYQHPNFEYSQQLRGFLNYMSMPRPWTFPSNYPVQYGYHNYRRRFIRIHGVNNSEVVVPFQRLRSIE